MTKTSGKISEKTGKTAKEARILFLEAVKDRPRDYDLHALNLAYLASYITHKLGKRDMAIKKCDGRVEDLMNEFKPDIVAISSVTQNYNVAETIAKRAKEFSPDALVVIGGKHFTALPENLSKYMDIGVMGEGEETFREIVKIFEEGRIKDRNRLSGVKGAAYHDNRDDRIIITNAPRPLIQKIDEIPFPDRKLLGMTGADKFFLMSSRGCPFKCVYCSSAQFWKNARFHSPEYVVREIEEIINGFAPKEIGFYDDLFVAKKERLREIIKLIKEKGIDKKVRIASVLMQTSLVDDEMCGLLKELGVKEVNMGFESGSERVLKYLKRESTSVAQNQKAIDILSRNRIHASGTFIIGSPGETTKDINETYDFAKQKNIWQGETHVLVPYPGTNIWFDAKEKGIVNDKMDWDAFDFDFDKFHEKAITVADKVSRKELLDQYLRFTSLWEKKFFKRKGVISMLRGSTWRDYRNTLLNPRKFFSFTRNLIRVKVFGQ